MIYEELISEGYISQLKMGAKMLFSGENTTKILKNHKNKYLLKLIDETNNLDDLMYLRKDIFQARRQFILIGKRIKRINEVGFTKETSSYYNGINNKYIKKGVTVKDVELTIKWLDEVALIRVSQKIKKIRSEL